MMIPLTSKNITYPYIYSPNRAALQEIASKYYEKYGVLIRETTSFWVYIPLIEELEQTIQGPQFVGIHVAYDPGPSEYTHALPLILFI